MCLQSADVHLTVIYLDKKLETQGYNEVYFSLLC